MVGLTLVLAASAFVALRGNRAIAASEAAASRSNWTVAAANARTAIRWAPWSARAWQLLGEIQIQQRQLGSARSSLRRALEKDPADWAIWFDLATIATGRERTHALDAAAKLNPLDPEVAALRRPSRGR
jgi:cytochrome c-type biogenesis protein CcmH/NrfG